MNKKILISLGLAVVVVGAVAWNIHSLFSKTVDWPLVILNGKADAIAAREATGSYQEAQLGATSQDYLAARGAGGRVRLVSDEDGHRVTVLVEGLSEHSCKGLERLPSLVENFKRIEVEGGKCADNATMRFFWE